jgi:hypothetical protein
MDKIEDALLILVNQLEDATPLVASLRLARKGVILRLRDSLEELLEATVPSITSEIIPEITPEITIRAVFAAERLLAVHIVIAQRGAELGTPWPERLTSLRQAVDIASDSLLDIPKRSTYLAVLARMLCVLRFKRYRLPHARIRAFRALLLWESSARGFSWEHEFMDSLAWEVAKTCFNEGRWASACLALKRCRPCCIGADVDQSFLITFMRVSCWDMDARRYATQAELEPICVAYSKGIDTDKCIADLERFCGPTSPSLAVFLADRAMKPNNGTAMRRIAVILRNNRGVSASSRISLLKYMRRKAKEAETRVTWPEEAR